MSAFRQLTVILALGVVAMPLALAQSSSSATTGAAAQATTTDGSVSVQARIRARRAQRRTAAIHEAYDHKWEASATMGYIRTKPGANLQSVTEYAWDASATRFLDARLGVTVDARGYYGTAFIPPSANSNALFKPSVSQFAGMVGPTYRFYMQPKYSVSGRVMAGVSYGSFSNDTYGSSTQAQLRGLFADSTTWAVSASVPVAYNLTPHLSMTLAPEFYTTGFGSKTQPSPGFNGGFTYRFGK